MGAKGKAADQQTVPRSIRHKQVLDIAEERPDASVEDIADEIPSATADYVENILDDYGDPAAEESDVSGEDDPNTEQETAPDLSELSEKQVETLEAIYDHPELTQSELGDLLDVCSATVCNRVKEIEGFDWEKRGEYVTKVLDSQEPPTAEDSDSMATDSTEPNQELQELTERVSNLEQQLNGMSTDGGSQMGLQDPQLTRKILQVCLHSEKITEEEEVQLLEMFVH